MKRKLLSLLVLLCLTVTSAWAETIGDIVIGGVEYTLNTSDHTAQVGYNPTYSGALTIPETVEYNSETYTVTSISNSAFASTDLTSVTIGNSVTSIGDDAFNDCTGLTSVTIGSGVKSIGEFDFAFCTGLTSVTIGSGVTSIGNCAFGFCSSLTSVTIYAANAPSLGDAAFAECPSGPSGLKTYVFYDCIGNYSGWPYVTAISDVTVSGVTARQNPDITTDYWCTYYHPQANVKINTTGVQMFKASLSGANLTLTEVDGDVIKAGQAVVLKAAAGGDLDMELTSSAPTGDFSGNELKGTSVAITGAAGNIYVLNAKTGKGAGFYKLSTSGTLAANRAYLTYSGSGGAAREFFSFDETTSIESVSVNENFENGEVYDLQGRRVVNPTKGLYIVNGKKVFINK